MAKFCGKCGSKLDEATGLCPNCDAEKIKEQSVSEQSQDVSQQMENESTVSEELPNKKDTKKKQKADKKATKKAKKREQWAKLTVGQKIRKLLMKLLLRVVMVIALGCVIVGGMSYCGIIDVPLIDRIMTSIALNTNTGGSVDEYEVDAPDAESYYENNSEIVSEINVSDSDDVMTEAETYAELAERGFRDYPITTEYTMDGEYSEATEISDSSSLKHPIYQTFYASANGEFWTIFVINGDIMANPVSYNLESTRDVQVIVSEAETVMSYDSTTGKFYETIPNESALCIVVVNKIDAATLDILTTGEIDNYE